jgi:hypothetical protein
VAVAGLETSHHPVEIVSWNDAADFCAKLSKEEKLKPFYFRAGETVTPLDGTGYRLPSEAEWEFACRAGTATKHWTGDKEDDLRRAAWIKPNDAGRTHAVGELKTNPFGLADMHGNVWEWAEDGWDLTYYRQFQDKPAIDPRSPYSADSQRVIRGGTWGYPAPFCRSAIRFASHPIARESGKGFRPTLTLDAVRLVLKATGSAIPGRASDAPSTGDTSLDFAAERKAAEWVLKVSGSVELIDAEARPVPLVDGILPANNFVVRTVVLNKNPNATESAAGDCVSFF